MITFIYWASTGCHLFHMGIHSSPLHQSSVRSHLHDGPHDHCLLVFMHLLSSPTCPQNYSVWPTEHSTVKASHFQGYAIKTCGFHLAVSWIIYSGGSQLLCHEDIQVANGEAPEARNWGLVPTVHGEAILETGLLVLENPQVTGAPAHTCLVLNQNFPAKLLTHSWPLENVWYYKCLWFLTAAFWIIC